MFRIINKLKLNNNKNLNILNKCRFFSEIQTANIKNNNPLHFLIIDGYTKEGREDLRVGGATTAGELYHNMLNKCSLVKATSDIVYPADDGFDYKELDFNLYDGVAWTGCSLTIYAQEQRVLRQIELAKHVYKLGIPSFGSCWSCQVSAIAVGGTCAANPRGREMGIARKIMLTPEGRSHPMFEGKPTVFDAFISHDDEVTHVPNGALILAGNEFTRIQALHVNHQFGEFWSVQYHPEYDLHELAMLTNCRIEKLTNKGFFKNRQAALEYIDDLEAIFNDPSRKDLQWKYGIDADVLSDDIRLVEVRNWVRKQVQPYRKFRLGLEV